ncbi:MAG: hypothetical protein IIY94_09450 [Oscillospiraceae bacterium]|nr:hypothetical protein [Oscillospiraceae bacterium]
MKRITTLFLALLLCFSLAGCSKTVGGIYKLDYITTDGVRLPPSNLGMNISFELLEDGIGTATYGATTLNITWAEDGDEVVVKSEDRSLRFSHDGENLILHSDGTILFFVPQETEEEED